MDPIRTPDMADTLVGEEGSGVEPLPVARTDTSVYSVWELDDDDRTRIAEGGHVGMVVFAATHPPVALIVAAPYCGGCNKPMDWSERLQTYVCSEGEQDDPLAHD